MIIIFCQILYFYFNRLQCNSNAFPAINKNVRVSRSVISKIQSYVNKVRAIFLFFRWFNKQVKVLFQDYISIFLFVLNINKQFTSFSLFSINILTKHFPDFDYIAKKKVTTGNKILVDY